jgi:hypothetical protein
VTKPLKAIPQQEFQKCFQQWSWVHSCCRGVLRRWPLSVNCKLTGVLAINSFRELHSFNSYLATRCLPSENLNLCLCFVKEINKPHFATTLDCFICHLFTVCLTEWNIAFHNKVARKLLLRSSKCFL